MQADKYGFKIPVQEIINNPNIVIWARIGTKENTIGPWMPIAKLEIDGKKLDAINGANIIDTYISFENNQEFCS